MTTQISKFPAWWFNKSNFPLNRLPRCLLELQFFFCFIFPSQICLLSGLIAAVDWLGCASSVCSFHDASFLERMMSHRSRSRRKSRQRQSFGSVSDQTCRNIAASRSRPWTCGSRPFGCQAAMALPFGTFRWLASRDSSWGGGRMQLKALRASYWSDSRRLSTPHSPVWPVSLRWWKCRSRLPVGGWNTARPSSSSSCSPTFPAIPPRSKLPAADGADAKLLHRPRPRSLRWSQVSRWFSAVSSKLASPSPDLCLHGKWTQREF